MNERELFAAVQPWLRFLMWFVGCALVLIACALSLSGHVWSVLVFLVAGRIVVRNL